MKFVLAPDSFKDSMTAVSAAKAMERGIKKIFKDADCKMCPMADGGEGTMEALVMAMGGRIIRVNVMSPTGKTIEAAYGYIEKEKTVIIEMAQASGLEKVNFSERNPLITTSYGTGQLILDALRFSPQTIIMCLGGSATNDGGVGMLQALGVSFLDMKGNKVPFGGGNLHKIYSIDVSTIRRELSKVKFIIASDVKNPLLGHKGASKVFAAQKGASTEDIEILEENMMVFKNVVTDFLKRDISNEKGAGAAGGMGYGIMAFLNGFVVSGAKLVMDTMNMEEQIKNADYVFTGEGSIDSQTLYGKTISVLGEVSLKYNVPLIAFGGTIKDLPEDFYKKGISSVIGISKSCKPLDEILKDGEKNLQFAVENICRILKKHG